MAKRIGVFVDVSNLYLCINKKFKKRKLNYEKYLSFISDLGEIIKSYAYGAQVSNEAQKFIYNLKKLGFTIKYKKPKEYINDGVLRRKADWDVGIAMEMVETLGHFDLIVLGTADGDLTPAVDWLRRKGIDVLILACRISSELKESATDAIEIPESLIEKEIRR